MAAPLAIPAIMGILRFAASKGVQEAVKKYGRSVYNEAVAAASKADKIGGQIRTQLNRLGKETKAGLPAKIRNALPSVTSQASKAPAIKGGRSRAVQKKTVEGEYIPKSQRSGTPSTESRRGSTYEGKSSGGSGGKEPPLRANPSDRFGGGRGQGPQGRMPKRSAVAAGAVAGAAATSLGDGEKKSGSVQGAKGSSYTIKKGDTLSAIARDSGVRLSELRDANPQIKDLNKIKPGQKLKVPGATIKGSGKSVYEGMTKAEMEKMAMKQKSRKGRGGRDVSAKDEADTLAMLRQEKLRRQNKAKVGMAKGGVVKANCGASMKPTQKSSKGKK